MDYQIDIFGNEIPIDDIPKEKTRLSIKEKFREVHGYKETGEKCGDCLNFAIHKHNRTYFKCYEIGLSNSSATDINKKDKACNLFSKL